MSIAARAHHMSFPVVDLDRSRHFYEVILGLVPIPRPDLGFPGAWYQAGPCEVHLLQVPADMDVGVPPQSLNPLGRHAAFAVGDYDATLALMQAHGLEVLGFGRERGQMWVKDPDGHVIELIVPRSAG